MANFNTHLSVGFVTSGIAGLLVYKAGLLYAPEFLLCTLLGTLGGLLPDIDLEGSTPSRIGISVVALIGAFASMLHWADELTVLELIVVWLVVYAMIRWGVFNLFQNLTVHRGIVHSVPYMACLAMGVVYLSFYVLRYSTTISWFAGLFLFFGSLVHLLLDEIYSVNVFNLQIKRSFGTAFKFFHKDQLGYYTVLYVLLAILVLFAPPFKIFWQTVSQAEPWQQLQHDFSPAYLGRKILELKQGYAR